MKYVYPAILFPEDGKLLVRYPDIPDVNTFGDDLADALEMASDALEMWLCHAEDCKGNIPTPTPLSSVVCGADEFANLVIADTDAYRRQHDSRAVNKTLTLPAWLNYQAEKANAPFSQILQQGLKDYLNIAA